MQSLGLSNKLNLRKSFCSKRSSSQQSKSHRCLRVTAEQTVGQTSNTAQLYQALRDACDDYKSAPPSVKQEVAVDCVLPAMTQLANSGTLTKWNSASEDILARRNIGLGELRMVGIKDPQQIAKVSVRNDASFLISVVGITSVLAVVLGQLPGDWGFWGAYGTGGISIVVLAIGSVNPGILQFAIDAFSQIFPDYKSRVLRHEAGHFLTGYLLGVPVASYSLMIGKEHTDFAEAKLQKRLIEKSLQSQEVDALSIVAMAGAAAEAMNYEEVMGQTADMFDLQRIMMRASDKMNNAAQQNQARWAVYQAATLLRRYKGEYEALQEAMGRGANVAECIEIIEKTTSSSNNDISP